MPRNGRLMLKLRTKHFQVAKFMNPKGEILSIQKFPYQVFHIELTRKELFEELLPLINKFLKEAKIEQYGISVSKADKGKSWESFKRKYQS